MDFEKLDKKCLGQTLNYRYLFIYLLEKSKYTKDKKQKKMREVLVLPCPIFCKRV